MKNIMKFENINDYKSWIQEQDWYQTITLPRSGLVTRGKFPTNQRDDYIKGFDFQNKRVLDVGCNSGQYALIAKACGAKEVVGIDIDEKRLNQARVLAANEGCDVEYVNMDVRNAPDLGVFDIVFCFAVLTEVPDFFGTVEALKKVTGQTLTLEIGCAHRGWLPVNPRIWRRSRKQGLPVFHAMAEIRQNVHGVWTFMPSFPMLRRIFSPEFTVQKSGRGLRYERLEVEADQKD